jgi:hypothetical protein
MIFHRKFVYSVNKLQELGWMPKLCSEEAVRKSIWQIVAQVAAAQ